VTHTSKTAEIIKGDITHQQVRVNVLLNNELLMYLRRTYCVSIWVFLPRDTT